jgi:predicted RNA-binding protein (virulence factor B family)
MDVKLGKMNDLTVVKTVDFGVYLDGGEEGEILLPTRYVPENCQPGDTVKVFLYLDSEERLIATTLTPLVQVDEFAFLEVAWVNEYGAFLNWGLMKDLFVPFREQKQKMRVGQSYLIHAHIDEESYRIMASAKVERYLSKEMPTYKEKDKVQVLVWQRTDLGYKVIVENRFSGMLYHNELFQPIEPGMRLEAYVKQVRPDGKLDLTLQLSGGRKVDDFAEVLLKYVQEHRGFIPYHDKSEAEEIYEEFEVSKKTFKKAVGDLYKKRLIQLERNGIRLVQQPAERPASSEQQPQES